jgi:hypothetical protein
VVEQVEDKIQEILLVVQVDQVEVVILMILGQLVQVILHQQILYKVLMEDLE